MKLRKFATRECEHKKAVEKGGIKISALAEHNIVKKWAIQSPGTLLKSFTHAQDGMKGAFWKAREINVPRERAINRDDQVWLPHEYLTIIL